MHELSVTENILKIALEHAQKAGAKQVSSIYLVIGDLSTIVDDSIQFYWEIIAKDTIAEKARLVFNRQPIEMQCNTCQTRFAPGKDSILCPNCGKTDIRILSGDQFFVDAIDIE